MLTRKRFLAAAIASTLLAIGAPAAHADTLQDIEKAKKIRVAIDLGVPPFGFKDEKLQATGSDVETAQMLAKDWGVELEIVPTTSPNRIPFLQTGKADIVISSLSITPERAKVVDFSVPYAVTYAIVAAPKSIDIKSPADLAGKKIVVTRGTSNDVELSRILPSGASVTRFDDDATSITSVVSGQAEIFATAPALLLAINSRVPEARKLESKLVLKTNGIGVGVRKGDTALKAKVDAFVKARFEDGTLDAVYRRYHNLSLPKDLLSNRFSSQAP